MKNLIPAQPRSAGGISVSRRHALALVLRASPWLAAAPDSGFAAEPLRLAISESLVAGVNLNDARAAMLTWIKRMSQELNIVVDVSPKAFEPTAEILRRVRQGQLDAVALNVIEYRQVADQLDPRQIVAPPNDDAMERYVLLAKQSGGIQKLADLRGRRLLVLNAARMCVADAWLSTILDEAHVAQSEDLIGSVATDTKVSRVVLPVFFGQADACLTSKRSFDTMCELNPQVARELKVLSISLPLVPTFYAFHNSFRGRDRDRFANVYSNISSSAAGRQLATLFQFETLMPRDISCLANTLRLLETADRVRSRRKVGNQ